MKLCMHAYNATKGYNTTAIPVTVAACNHGWVRGLYQGLPEIDSFSFGRNSALAVWKHSLPAIHLPTQSTTRSVVNENQHDPRDQCREGIETGSVGHKAF